MGKGGICLAVVALGVVCATATLGDMVLHFQGDAVVEIGANKFPTLSDLTLEAWIRTTVRPNNNNYGSIAGQGYLGSTTGFGLFTSFSANEEIAFQARNGSKTASASASYSFADEWHHVAGVREGDISKLYLDGVLVSVTTQALTTIKATYSFGLGARYNGSWGYYFNGYMADVRLWDYARSAAEIALKLLTAVTKCCTA